MRRLTGRRLSSRRLAAPADSDPTVPTLVRSLETRVAELESTVAELQEEIDETRRDGRRIAEVYDLVFQRLRAGS